jgi:hypothetical protein
MLYLARGIEDDHYWVVRPESPVAALRDQL